MRRPPQLAQTARPLHESGTRRSKAQSSQRTRRNQLAHVGVEVPVDLPVPLDVEEEHAPHRGRDGLSRWTSRKSARGVLEAFGGRRDVVERHAPVTTA